MSDRIKNGFKINKWTVQNADSQYKLNVICECGNTSIVSKYDLINSKSRMCRSCADSLPSTHGKTNTTAHNVWMGIKARCKQKYNKDYGGRGITFCKSWENFEQFYKDMGECPKGFSIERIDVNLGYSKSNCIWIDRKLQNRNKRNTIRLMYKNKLRDLFEIAEMTGVHRDKIYYRIFVHNYTLEEAIISGHKPANRPRKSRHLA